MKCTGKLFSVLLFTIGLTLTGLSAADHAAAQDAATLQAELEKQRASSAQLKAVVAKLEGLLAAEKAARDQQLAAGDATQKILAVLQQEVETLRKELAKVQTERDKNFKSVVELTDQLHQAFNEVKQLKEENARLRALVPNPPPPADRPPKLEGVVQAVANGNLVEISLGADDGLKSGHRLIVYRVSGGTRTQLGHVDVLQTAPDKAICKVDSKSLKGPIRKGDRVTTGESAEPRAAEQPKPGAAPDLVGGEVLAVGDDGEVEISFGSADGLRPGHRLEVYRITGSEGIYVGRIEVVKTTAKASTCKSILEFEKHPIQKGDRVTSKL